LAEQLVILLLRPSGSTQDAKNTTQSTQQKRHDINFETRELVRTVSKLNRNIDDNKKGQLVKNTEYIKLNEEERAAPCRFRLLTKLSVVHPQSLSNWVSQASIT